jgi:hypothetical protein
MEDAFGRELRVGDTVAYAAGSQYVHMMLGEVTFLTPKGVVIRVTHPSRKNGHRKTLLSPNRVALVMRSA